MKNVEFVTEGCSKVFVYKNKVSVKGPGLKSKVPFYNPAMELNRDLSIIVGQWLVDNSKDHIRFLDGLASSGIRGIRLANEVEGDFDVTINDWDEDSFNLIEKNIEHLKLKDTIALNCNLNSILSENIFNYIDVDPFGSPVYFIDSAMRSIMNNGIIACTATDTATLCGVYPKVCFRRYGAVPFHSMVMKEIALRILLGFICRTAAIYDKGIRPLLCYSSDHYFRVYVQIFKDKDRANDSMNNYSIIKKNQIIGIEQIKKDTGPIWTGNLHNERIIKELIQILFKKQLNSKNFLWKLLDLLQEEADAPNYFFTTDSLASKLKRSPLKMTEVFERLKKEGYDVFRTHFSPTGFKTNAPMEQIEKVFNSN